MDNHGEVSDPHGYSTKEALSILHDDIQKEVDQHEQNEETNWTRLICCFGANQVRSLYHWTTAIYTFIISITMFAASALHYDEGNPFYIRSWWLVLGVILILIVVLNIALSIWCEITQRREYVYITSRILRMIKDGKNNVNWTADIYPNICSPRSPCLKLQWTLRDGLVVNLPQPLLVKGDIILMRPGHEAPGECREFEDSGEIEDVVLYRKDVYTPQIDCLSDTLVGPQSRTPLKAKKFILLETPFITNIREILSRQIQRPPSVMDNEHYLLIRVWIECRIIPAVFLLVMLTNVLRWMYLGNHVGHWSEMLLVSVAHSLLPLLILIFPLMWFLINFYGQARILSVFEVAKTFKQNVDESFDSLSTISVEEARVEVSWNLVCRWFRDVVMATAPVISRQVNIMHALGSITSLCCVDKKGVISWPNPTAEKVFFFSREHREKKTSRSYDQELGDGDSINLDPSSKKSNRPGSGQCLQNHIEVLDLSHDAKVFLSSPPGYV